MSQTSILGGLATGLFVSFVWPYCFQKQWGVHGCLRTCPCLTALPCCYLICSKHSNTACDCGWMVENDHAYFGTDEERAEEEARERAMRLAWADHLIRERERQRIVEVVGGVKGGVAGLGGALQGVGHRVHGVTDKIPFGHFGHASRAPAGTTAADVVPAIDTAIDSEGVGGASGARRKNVLQRLGERNLDDIVGGSRARASRPGSVLYDGAPGVESVASVRRRESSGMGRSGSGARRSGARFDIATTRRRAGSQIVDGDLPALNRGTMASQTVVQRQYGPTAPMTIGSSMPHDEPAPPAYK